MAGVSMPMKNRRFIFWSLLALVLGATIWWILYVPYHPDRVFTAIPANASVISVHENLAGEWDQVFTNPLLRKALAEAGVADTNVAELADDRDIRSWTERLASDRSVIAYVPSLGTTHSPAIVAASWIGNQSRLLRWQVAFIRSRDLVPVKLDEGRITVWLTRTKFGKTGMKLSLALSEGLVLACISTDPVGVRALLESAEHFPNHRSIADTGHHATARALLSGSPRHWGWIETSHSPLAFRLDLEAQRLALDAVGPSPLPAAPPLNSISAMKDASDLLATTSDLAVILPARWIPALIPTEGSPLCLAIAREWTDTTNLPADALALIALLDGKHHGRLKGPLPSAARALAGKGVKTPTLLVGLNIPNSDDGESRMRHLIEQVNSRYGLALATRRDESGSAPRLTAIESVSGGIYGQFKNDEQLAYSVSGKWLILGSNAGALRHLLSEPKVSQPRWDSGASCALFRGNLDGIGSTLRNALGVAKLATMMDSSEKSKQTLALLDQAETGTAVLRSLGQIQASASITGSLFQLKVVLGNQKPQPQNVE